MRISSFIGLILLVVALMVASTPALLTPASRGAERALIELGAIKEQDRDAKPEPATDEAKAAEPVPSQLAFRGHQVEEDGDLRDLVAATERAGYQGGRLEAGNRRLPLPGQPASRDAAALPPVTTENGFVLDATGCPQFDPSADVAAIMADPGLSERYVAKAADADDPEACRALLERLAADASGDGALPGDRRGTAERVRSGSERLLLEVYRVQLLAELMGVDEEDRQRLAEGARATLEGA